jgi:plastocyanin
MEARGSWALFIILIFFSCISSPKHEPSAEKESYSVEDDIPPTRQKDEATVHVVEIKQMKFEPREIKVHKGDRVLWINKDITDHDVTEQLTKAWASSPLASGESWSMVVTESADYYCNLHQVMKGKIVVE